MQHLPPSSSARLATVFLIVVVAGACSDAPPASPGPCAGVECGGHGQCAVLGSGPICVCDDAYIAHDLVCRQDPCATLECSGHGSCVADADAAHCECEPGFEPDGFECVAVGTPDPCDGVTCSGFGECVSDRDVPSCRCDDGYIADGLTCVPDAPPVTCDTVTCSGHGYCVQVDGAAHCSCHEGYEAAGLQCVPDTTPSPCDGVACSGHGTCVVVGGAAACVCDPPATATATGLECIEPEPDEPARPIWFVHITDTHFGESSTIDEAMTVVVDEVIPTINPAITINSGDVTDGGEGNQWAEYRAIIEGMVPDYPVYMEIPGNHDVKHDHADNFIAFSQTGRAGGGLYGQNFVSTESGRLRVIRANTADTDINLINIAGSFGDDQADDLMALVDGSPPSPFVVAIGHHPMTGVQSFALGVDKLHTLLSHTGSSIYFCGHTHWTDLRWFGPTLMVQGTSLGKADPTSFALVALDSSGPAAKFVAMEPEVTWPQVLVTSPADAELGGVNPRADSLPAGAVVTLRALAFSPDPIAALSFEINGVVTEADPVDEAVWEASAALPDASGRYEIDAVATDSANAVGSHTVAVWISQ